MYEFVRISRDMQMRVTGADEDDALYGSVRKCPSDFALILCKSADR